jgi:hypothetical protein
MPVRRGIGTMPPESLHADISIMASVTRAPIATAAERQRRAAAQRRFDWRRPLRGLYGGIALAIAASSAAGADLPERLSDTGLNRDGVIAFEPQYSLWSDGTHKRRWLYLPPGRFIDASDADAWKFPRGTKLWKEFAYGSRIETRYITLDNDGQWRFATYVWNADGSAALLAPERGISRLPVADAPDGRYPVPSRNDCLICHEGARVPVLGFYLMNCVRKSMRCGGRHPISVAIFAARSIMWSRTPIPLLRKLRRSPSRMT